MQNLNVSNKVLRVCISRIIISYIFFFFLNFMIFTSHSYIKINIARIL